ncbi:large ribosomal subunit protein uL30m [Epargyreus clarus]|uniref:large ribosomal subunit protein uL30m n=1 Tax=Epargyreus clarus TaxID=520877 RepID=UPI003C2C7322
MQKQLLNVFNPLYSSVRTRIAKHYKHPGGIRYPGGITYYPRHPDEKEPEITPAKLFRVERVKKTLHQPYWLKNILKEFSIHEENRVTIVKNIPEVNAKLWKVKHLIKITPITFPYGEPTEEDIKYTVLKENGECVVTKTLKPLEGQVEALEEFHGDEKKMNSDTIKRDSRHKWNNAFTGGF